MKQTDIYTEALVCLRLILQTDHPEFKNWLDWLERDIEDWTQRVHDAEQASYHPHKGLNRAIAQHLMQGNLQDNLDRL